MVLRSGAVFLLLTACAVPAVAESLTRDELHEFLDSTVQTWRFQLGEVPAGGPPGGRECGWLRRRGRSSRDPGWKSLEHPEWKMSVQLTEDGHE